MSNLILSAYGSHNAAVAMYYNGKYTVVEVERWLNSKNMGLTSYLPSYNMQLVFDEICEYLLAQTDQTHVDVYITGYMDNIKPKFEVRQTITCDHHLAHAAAAFYQSPYPEALVFTYDGGGDGGFFNVYLASRKNGVQLLNKFNQDLGFAYMILGDYLGDIKKETLSIGNLVYAGKLMGLCSYGKVNKEWLPHFERFYSRFNYIGDSYLGGAETKFSALTELFNAIGVPFDAETSSFTGQLAWDIAATTQAAFESEFFRYAASFLKKHSKLPVALSGGCALNVLLNTILLKQRKGAVYVPPNTNDCGIAAGGLLWHLAPQEQADLTYSGLPVLDAHLFSEYMEERQFALIPDIGAKEIAKFIADGNILGVIQGNSEHGSRALGNRSIICNPIEGMKDKLNKKVKNREWYRPFAPIVRVDDVQKYFNFAGTESRHMVFVANVRDEWKATLPAITHEDGTGRLQTVTREQNELIYDIITEFEPLAGHAVILNTSFNVNGKPILTRLSDALHILRTSKLGAVYYKGNLICRSADARVFKQYQGGVKQRYTVTTGTCVYMSLFDPDLNHNMDRYVDLIRSAAALPETKVVVILQEEDAPKIAALHIPGVYIHSVGVHRHYYEKTIQQVRPELKTTMELSEVIKLLWAKEALRENIHNATEHVFVDLVKCKDINVLPLISKFRKAIDPTGEASVVSTIAGITESYFNADFYRERYSKVPTITFTPHIIAGHEDDLNWLLTNYEGIMNRCLMNGKNGTEADYLTISFVENNERLISHPI